LGVAESVEAGSAPAVVVAADDSHTVAPHNCSKSSSPPKARVKMTLRWGCAMLRATAKAQPPSDCSDESVTLYVTPR